MHTHIYVAVAESGDGDDINSGCGIILFCKPDAVNTYRRDYGFQLGTSSKHLSAIQSVRLSLTSVMPKHRQLPLTLYANEPVWRVLYLPDDHLENLCATDNERMALDEMRTWWNKFEDIKVIPTDEGNAYIIEAQKLATNAIDIGRDTDSGTLLRDECLASPTS